MSQSDANALCVQCGLCCNGVIFADVQLQPQDTPERLRQLGVKLLARAAKTKTAAGATAPKFRFTQPCCAFEGQCRIYDERPYYCRQFECALFKGVQAGHLEFVRAGRLIKTAHQRAEKVRKRLRLLGDTDETLALSKRFQRLQRCILSGPIDEESAEIFGELTLAVQDLNVLLSDVFYPGRE